MKDDNWESWSSVSLFGFGCFYQFAGLPKSQSSNLRSGRFPIKKDLTLIVLRTGNFTNIKGI